MSLIVQTSARCALLAESWGTAKRNGVISRSWLAESRPAGDRCSCATSAGLRAQGATEVQSSGSRNLAYLAYASAIVLIKKLRPIRRDHQRRGVARRNPTSLAGGHSRPRAPEQSRVPVTAALTLTPGPELPQGAMARPWAAVS